MDDPIHPDTLLERAPTALWRVVLDGVLVLAAADDEPLHVSSPGDVIWQLVAEPITFGALTDVLADLYDLSSATVQADIEPVLAVLLGNGALRRVPTPS